MSREKAYQFGDSGQLVGILCEPLDVALGRSKPAILLSNVGVSHRVGPFRLNVELARRLAGLGFYSLRFDFSGLGDSDASREDTSEAARAIAEAGAAMDLLAKRAGIDRFVMIGLCSGADKTHLVAAADPRIVGAAFIDGYAYPTWLFHLRRYTLRLLEGKRVAVFLRKRGRRLRERLAGTPEAAQSYDAVVIQPSRGHAEQDLVRMARRGVKQLHIYTISVDNAFNYTDQFWDMFPALKPHRQTVLSERYPQVDHTLSIVRMQRIVVDRLCAWMAQF